MAEPLKDRAASAAAWLIDDWMSGFGKAIESMVGALPVIKAEVGAFPAEVEAFWWEQEISAGTGASAVIGAPEESWKEIGGKVLKAAGVDDGVESDLKSTYQEVLNQSLSGLAQGISARLRREVLCSGSRELPTPWKTKASFIVTVRLDQDEVRLYVAWSDALVLAVDPEEAPKPESKVRAGESAEPSGPLTTTPKALELLLDVELPVSVSFGRAQLPLKDVLKLTTGSIVELNRNVSEPVEIIVNNCIIARGQVVVVEGYFGVRVQHVISRQERLRTIR